MNTKTRKLTDIDIESQNSLKESIQNIYDITITKHKSLNKNIKQKYWVREKIQFL